MDESTERRSRRQLLFGGLAAAAAVALGRLAGPNHAAAANGDPVVAGSTTDATAPTVVRNTTASTGSAFRGVGSGTTRGVAGESDSGVGVIGHSPSGYGVSGSSDAGLGVQGISTNAIGVVGTSTWVYGVLGQSLGNAGGVVGTTGVVDHPTDTFDSGVVGLGGTGSAFESGVWGESNTGVGVYGTGPAGIVGEGEWGVYGTGGVGVAGDVGVGATGVYGFVGSAAAPVPTANVGVEARAGSTAQLALNVVGRAKFSRSGRTLIGAGRSSLTINLTGVTSSSLVFANLYTYRAGTFVISATPVAGSFTIRLNRALTSSAYVVWFVLN